MSLSSRILRRIEKHFSDNDFQRLDYNKRSGEFIFSNGKETALVRVLFEDEADSAALTHALTSVVKKALNYNRVYIAAPAEAYKKGFDTASFTENEVGLILYDEFDAYEEVPAESSVRKGSRNVPSGEDKLLEKSLVKIESSFKELSERVDSLEKAYLSLLREVREIRRLIERRSIIEEKTVQQPVELEEPRETGELPSFLKNNPWVEILSKRSEDSV